MKNVKYIIIIILLGVFVKADAQNNMMESLNKLNDYTMEILGAFFMNPDNSLNNKLVYEKICQLEKFYSDELDNQYSCPDKNLFADYFNSIETMKNITNVMSDFLNPLAGYVGGSIDASSFDSILKPILEQFNWSCKTMSVNCSDIIFYEYTYKNFKMLLAYNTRPKASRYQEEQGIYNDNEVKCYAYIKEYRKIDWFIKLVVRGGTYRIVEFKDDTNTSYKNLVKATSSRMD